MSRNAAKIHIAGLVLMLSSSPVLIMARQDAAATLRNVVSARQNIDHAFVQLHSTYRTFRSPEIVSEIEGVISGFRIKQTRKTGGNVKVSCFQCYNNRHHVEFDSNTPQGPCITINNGAVASRHELQYLAADPRYVGALPSDYLNSAYTRPESFYTPDGSGVTASKEVIDGEECEKLGFTNSYGVPVEVWTVPSKGFAIRKLQTRAPDNPGIGVVVESELRFNPESSIWFPSKVSFVQKSGGDVKYEEELIVQRVQFDRLDAEEFSISGIEHIKSGTSVNWNLDEEPPCTPTRTMQWNGTELDCLGKAEFGVTKRNAWRFWLLNGALLLLLSGALVMYRAWKKRSE